jgi:hypothetical protein
VICASVICASYFVICASSAIDSSDSAVDSSDSAADSDSDSDSDSVICATSSAFVNGVSVFLQSFL